MTSTATHSATEIVLAARRPARDPLAWSRREAAAKSFPWLLFVVSWFLLFAIQNDLEAPAHPPEEQTSAELAQAAQEGSVLARVVIVSLGAIGMGVLVRNRSRIRLNVPYFTMLALFLGWSAATALWADDPALTLRRLVSMFLMVLFAAGCSARMSAEKLSIFIAAIPALGLIPSVAAEMRYGVFNPFSSSHRFGGTSPHPNVEAANLSVAVILYCWLAWRSRGLSKRYFTLSLFMVTSFLFMTGSRTSIIAVIVSLAFWVGLWVVRDRKRWLPLLIAGTVLLVGVGGLLKLTFSGSAEDPFAQAIKRDGDVNDASTLNGRLDLWRQCLKFAARRPILGYGFGGFWSPKRIEAISAFQTWPIQQSHSSYIEELLALGVPGLVMYVGLLFGGIWVCTTLFLRRREDAYGAWAAVLLFMAIHNGTEAINVKGQYTNMVFDMLILYLAIMRPGDRITEQSSPCAQRTAPLQAELFTG